MSFGEYFSMSCNSLLKLLQHFVFLVFQGQGGSLDARLGYGCFGQASTHRPTIPERSPVPSQVPAGDEGT